MDTNLQAVLTDLRERRDRFAAAVQALELALGLESTPALPSSREPAQIERRAKPSRREKPADDAGEAIIAALQKHGPMSPSELKTCAKISDYILRSRLQALGSRVVVSGTTADRMIGLPGQSRPKEAP